MAERSWKEMTEDERAEAAREYEEGLQRYSAALVPEGKAAMKELLRREMPSATDAEVNTAVETLFAETRQKVAETERTQAIDEQSADQSTV